MIYKKLYTTHTLALLEINKANVCVVHNQLYKLYMNDIKTKSKNEKDRRWSV